MRIYSLAVSFIALQKCFGKRVDNLRRAQQVECLGVIEEKQYEDNIEETILNCERSDGTMIPIVGVSEAWTQRKASNGEFRSGRDFLEMPVGTTERDGVIIVPPGKEIKIMKGRNHRRRQLAVTTGAKTVLAVRVEASDASTTSSEADISDNILGTSGDPVNLASQYAECSHNALTFSATTRNNIINGVTTVNIPSLVVSGASDGSVRDAVTAALNTQFGVSSPSQLADHVMYCLPGGTAGSWIAYAYVNHWLSVYNNQWCNYVSGQMHEIGHNLALAHSNEGATAYADQSGMMGYSYGSDDGPRMCFNAAKSFQLGWYSNNVQTVTLTSGLGQSYTLVGIVNYPNDTSNENKVVLKVETGTPNDYYINFNRRTGFNSGTQEGGDQVTIVLQGGDGVNYSQSDLLAKLSAGGSYTISDPALGADLVITVDAIDLTSIPSVAQVSLCLGNCAPTPPTPNPTPAPTTKPPTKSPTASPTAFVCQTAADCPDDGNMCTRATCTLGVCGSESVTCDDGLFCNGLEVCNPSVGCVSGPPPCTECNEMCNETTDTCEIDPMAQACCGDGVCDASEDCNSCAQDCPSFPFPQAVCGNGICEDGETCQSCPFDCKGTTKGKPNQRFCCAGGPVSGVAVQYGVGCDDSRCGKDCDINAIPKGSSCCGDGVCEVGEDYFVCNTADCSG